MSKKNLPDYTILIDEIDHSYRYGSLWESDICVDREMYKPGTYIMFQMNITSKNEYIPRKLYRFYEIVKELCDDSIIMDGSLEHHGINTGKIYHVAEVEFHIRNLDECKSVLYEIMRRYKLLCSYTTPLVTMDINMSLIDNSNFNTALEVVRIIK